MADTKLPLVQLPTVTLPAFSVQAAPVSPKAALMVSSDGGIGSSTNTAIESEIPVSTPRHLELASAAADPVPRSFRICLFYNGGRYMLITKRVFDPESLKMEIAERLQLLPEDYTNTEIEQLIEDLAPIDPALFDVAELDYVWARLDGVASLSGEALNKLRVTVRGLRATTIPGMMLPPDFDVSSDTPPLKPHTSFDDAEPPLDDGTFRSLSVKSANIVGVSTKNLLGEGRKLLASGKRLLNKAAAELPQSGPLAPLSMPFRRRVRGMINVEELEWRTRRGEIDTVIVGFTDAFGRLMGKRFDAGFFLADAVKNGTRSRSYLLSTDMGMGTIPGYPAHVSHTGYGDYHLIPDLNTLRVASWLDRTALVLCDVEAGYGTLVAHAPRSMLRRQLDNLRQLLPYTVMAASEVEYYVYRETLLHAKEKRFLDLKPVGSVSEGYHILQGTREEFFHGPARRHLEASGVPVENSKGETGFGQHELNMRYSDVLEMADRHIVYKQCLKELADGMGVSVTFMAKPTDGDAGSSCHIHLSLWREGRERKENVFAGDVDFGPIRGCSDEFLWFLGGWMHHTPDMMVFYAPNVNSYKRFVSPNWSPTSIAWSKDNRTVPFRVVGEGDALHIECRLSGSDCNPYLAFTAALASGLDGLRKRIDPPPLYQGEIPGAPSVPTIPRNLAEATALFESSEFAKEALGEAVHKHYVQFFKMELQAYDRVVTDWEKLRYFEMI